MNFFRTPKILPWLFPSLTWRMDAGAKELYLTFDDGPVPGPTEFVLETLQKAQARATFFCIGDNIRKHPALFRKIVQEGHAVGNHTFNHLSGWKTGTPAYLENVSLCDAQIQLHGTRNLPSETLGMPGPQLFRPPYGRITRNQIKSLSDYNIVMWDVLTHDYAHGLAASRCLKGAVAATRPGSIIVFHDSFKAERNMCYVLPTFIEHFIKLGFTFKSLT